MSAPPNVPWEGAEGPAGPDPVNEPAHVPLLLNAAQALDAIAAAVNASINAHLSTAIAANMVAGQAVTQQLDQHLAVAAEALTQVVDAIQQGVLGLLASAWESGAQAGALAVPAGAEVQPSLTDPISGLPSAGQAKGDPNAATAPLISQAPPEGGSNPTSWYCIQNLVSGLVASIGVTDPSQIPDGWQIIAGPFDTSDAASQACSPPPPPAPPPPQEGTPSPPPPSPPAPVGTVYYCASDPSGQHVYASPPLDPANLPIGVQIVSGPYPDIGSASVACALPPPPPSPPAPSQGPPWYCATLNEGETPQVIQLTDVQAEQVFSISGGPYATQALAQADKQSPCFVAASPNCPISPPPACGTPQNALQTQSPFWPDWSSADVCTALATLFTSGRKTDFHQLGEALGLYNQRPDGGWTPIQPPWMQAIVSLPGGEALGRLIFDSVDGLGKVMVGIVKPGAQQVEFIGYYRILASLLGLAQQYLRVDVSDIVQTLEYARSYLSPTNLPGQAQVNDLFYSDLIRANVWECLTRANDNLPSWQALLLRAGRRQPTAAEAQELFLRGRYTSADYAQSLRQLGVTDDGELKSILSLAERFPDLGQAIRFKALGVYDDETLARYRLDEGSAVLAQAPYASWIKATGYSPDALSAVWRAHWQAPAVGEIVQAVRRLRPGAVDRALEVTEADVDYFLEAGQVHPWWRARFKALTVNPLGRREVGTAYQFGVVDDARATRAILDTGYTQETAQVLLATFKQRQRTHFASTKWLTYLREGAVSKTEALRALATLGCPADVAQSLVNETMEEFAAESRKRVIAAIHKYFTTHALGAIDAQGQLTALGLDADQVQIMLRAWDVERQAHPREAKAGEITTWLDNGLLTAVQAAQRLALIGYSAQDAGRIVARAQQLLSARQASRAEKAARDLNRATAQQAKGAEQRSRQEAAAAKARQAQQIRRQAFIERTGRNRLVTVRLYSARAQVSTLEAETALGTEVARIKRDYGLSDNEGWDTIKAAVHRIPKKGDFDLAQLATEAAEAERAILASLPTNGAGQPGG